MKLDRNPFYWLLVAGSLAWIGLVVLAPWARAQGFAWAETLYSVFAPVCHQLPGRSAFCFGQPLAACHRCLGLYAGFAAGLLAWPYLERPRRLLLEHPRRVLAAIAPLVADVVLGQLGIHDAPWSRIATGLAAAFAVSLFVWAAATQLWAQGFKPRFDFDSHEPSTEGADP